jgi:hypothetical protein
MGWRIVTERSKDMAVHAIVVPTGNRGKILYFGGYDVDDTHLYDVETETIADISEALSFGYNAFCSGHAFLADGRLLVAGGQLPSPGGGQDQHGHGNMEGGGERRVSIFHPLTPSPAMGIVGTWAEVSPMNLDPAGHANSGGRWYPTLTTLPNGDVLAIGGHPDVREVYPAAGPGQRHANNVPERYNAGPDSWTLLGSDPPTQEQRTDDNASDYHRTHLLLDGRVFVASPVNGKNRVYDPYLGKFVASPVYDLPAEGTYQGVSAAWTSVMLPLLHQEGFRERILLMGGETAQRIDLGAANPQWAATKKRDWSGTPPVRQFVSPVILPTGQIFLAGGSSQGGDQAQANCVLEGEIYDPGIDWQNGEYDTDDESWQTVEAATVGRHYHGTAILMPNGAVWTAGSNGPSDEGGGRELRIEIYEPSYFGQNRPQITDCPPNIGYGFPFTLETPQANSISRVALLRCGSVTHGFNPDQRYLSVSFEVVNSNTLRVQTPVQAEAAPPGRYMVWIIDEAGRPCEQAAFIRISKQKALVSADISTYSVHEVEALGTSAVFDQALFVVYDGFLPDEVEEPTLTLRRPDNTAVPGMSATAGAPLYEGGQQNKDTAQRVVFPIEIRFTSQQAFDQIPASDDFQNVTFTAKMRDFTCTTTLVLSKNPNPRMRDGDPPWLSIDLRAFSTRPGQAFTAAVTHGSGLNAPYDYIQAVLQAYNAAPGTQPHPFDSLPTDQGTNKLPLYSQDAAGHNVFNYAVARVRFVAPPGIDAIDVRVFFRQWTTGWTSLEYNTNGSYRRSGDGPGATPLLGLTGGEINNVPCFAEPRNPDMEAQTDTTNRRTMEGAGANEVFAYFGCWLDFNQNVKLFPLKPQGNGPYSGDLKSIQELMRGLHQCLVAEIHYQPDPIAAGATPGSSDNLAQRNLLLDESDNPGGFASHLVHHTFEIKPSPFKLPAAAPRGGSAVTARLHPDELAIDWGNLPRDSQVTFYLPQIDVDETLRYAGFRNGPAHLRRAGAGALQCKVADVSFIPIPGPFTTNLAGLMKRPAPARRDQGAEVHGRRPPDRRPHAPRHRDLPVRHPRQDGQRDPAGLPAQPVRAQAHRPFHPRRQPLAPCL